jgi:hypothetical protein
MAQRIRDDQVLAAVVCVVVVPVMDLGVLRAEPTEDALVVALL